MYRLHSCCPCDQSLSCAHSIFVVFRLQDDALFQRNFQQLQVYYSDLRSALPPSELEPTIIGMNLLRLLVANRIAELHVELEMLSPETQAHPSIAFPRQLEQALMEGTYRQVLAASSNSPSEYMQPLLQQLAATVRDELAACASAVCLCVMPNKGPCSHLHS